MTRISRRGDTVARLGGDEFVLLCTGLRDDDDLELICDRVMRAVCAPQHDGPHDLTVTCSLGAVVTSECSATPEELLQQADIAMYAAKRSGGNRFEVYTTRTSRRLTVRAEFWPRSFGARSMTRRCSCSTSRCSTCRTARCWAPRRSCAGATPSAA